jgi:hypothetical protein
MERIVWMQMQRSRPFGITVLAILAGVACVIDALVTLLFLGAIPVALFGRTGFFGSALLGAIIWGVMAVIWAWVAGGLWNLNPQTWNFVVLFSTLNIILAFVSVLGASTWGSVLPSIIVNAVVLIYSLTPGVRAAFGQARPQG